MYVVVELLIMLFYIYFRSRTFYLFIPAVAYLLMLCILFRNEYGNQGDEKKRIRMNNMFICLNER